MAHRYIYDHGTSGSHHDGGLGDTVDLDHAIREAARVDGLGPDSWCGVRDRETGDTIIVSRRALDGGPRLTQRTALRLLRERASIQGWVRPAHRPRRDPAAARVVRSYRMHPATIARIDAAAKRTGESAGQVVDRLASGLAPRGSAWVAAAQAASPGPE